MREPKKITFKGENLTIAQWAGRLGVRSTVLRERLKRGWPMEKAMALPKLAKGENSDGLVPTITTRKAQAVDVPQWHWLKPLMEAA